MSEYQKITPAARTESGIEGDFVHDSQTMASGDGFKNVSKLWFDQTLTFDQALEALHAEESLCSDVQAPVNQVNIELDETNKLVLQIEGEPVYLTSHSQLQLATWCDLSHGFVNQMTEDKKTSTGKLKYNRDGQDAQTLLVAFLNGKRRLDGNKKLLFRLKDVDGRKELRAVMSDKYDAISNIWYMELLQSLMPDARVSHWRGDIDAIYGNILIPDTIRVESDSEYGGMIAIGNSEIGTRRLSQRPSVFRAICMNGCIWGQTEGEHIRKVHRGIELAEIEKMILANINEQIPLMESVVDSFLETRKREIHKDLLSGVFLTVAKDLSLSRGLKGQAMNMVGLYKEHEQEHQNLFGIINAITRVGQECPNQTWVKCDEYAGRMVHYTENQFDRLVATAKSVQPKDIEKVFGVESLAV